jgi:molybdopterin converting factor small subunit
VNLAGGTPEAMAIRIEFFAIPRHRAGVAEIDVEAATLGDALREVRRRLPQLDEVCLTDGRLGGGYLASLNGRDFVSDPSTPLADGDCLLILSSDAGG